MVANLIRFVWSGLLVLLAVATPAAAETRDLVDVLGRKVSVEVPVKRAVIGMYIEDVLAIGGRGTPERIAGLSTGTLRDWTAGKWRAHLEKTPKLGEIPDMGEVESGTFSIEKVIAQKPEVVVLAAWQAEALGPNMERLSAAGVPVVVVDYNAQTLARHRASTLLIGALFGAEARANQLVAEYEAAVADVRIRVEKLGAARPKAYIELGNRGPAQYGNSYGKAMWAQLLEMAGADNIAKDKVGNWGPLTAEAVIAARPEHIFLSGGDWPGNATALRMGFAVGPAEARAKLAEFIARPGWSDLPAVKNGRVHAVSQSMVRSLHDYTQLQFIAKMMYPEAFRDVVPEENLRRFYRTYLEIEPAGTFMLPGQ